MAADRLQKILAHAGIASRRAAEALIRDGRVRLNGRVVTELGVTADSYADKIEVDGRRVVLEKPAYYVVHKPREMVTTLSDPEGRAHLGDVLEKIPERVYPVGRLDYHTSGAVLVTNDGELTDALLHPKRKVPKVYAAKLKGHLDVPELDRLRNGVTLDDGYVTKPAEVFVLREETRTTWVQITLYEGKNRQIHRMAEAIGHPVQRLVRVSFAGITTEGLRPGRWRELNKREVEKLEKTYVKPSRADKAKQTADALDRASSPIHALGDPSDRDSVTWSSASKRSSAPKRSAGASRSGAKREGSWSTGASRDAKSGGAKREGSRSTGASRDAKSGGAKREGSWSTGASRDAKSGGAKREGSWSAGASRDGSRSAGTTRDAKSGGAKREGSWTSSGRDGSRSAGATRDPKSGGAARDASKREGGRSGARVVAKAGGTARDASKRDGSRSGSRDAKSAPARDASKRESSRGGSRDAKSGAPARDASKRGASKSGSARDVRGTAKSAGPKRDAFERGPDRPSKSGAAPKSSKSAAPTSRASKPGASKKAGATKSGGASKKPASAGAKRKTGGRAGARGSGS